MSGHGLRRDHERFGGLAIGRAGRDESGDLQLVAVYSGTRVVPAGQSDVLDLPVTSAATSDPTTLVRAVAETVHLHADGAEQSDDITLMAVTWTGKA